MNPLGEASKTLIRFQGFIFVQRRQRSLSFIFKMLNMFNFLLLKSLLENNKTGDCPVLGMYWA